MRRPTHAAGYSWRKWEDPILVNGGYLRRSRFYVALLLVTCIEAGATAALVLFR
jgi:hypothetical protein